jgi:hypothetical protein
MSRIDDWNFLPRWSKEELEDCSSSGAKLYGKPFTDKQNVLQIATLTSVEMTGISRNCNSGA